ncbi:HD domain-containing phosphohydrolase [Colwellia psychrerythraea]|uniref:Response regulator receiver protein n=1 Tax=Colwellia psychrerythraea TaxID=28229 RepID=A0A099KIN6_COLPS|nr:HD domain-containing phosphohydrolase [Colwellia psychrerythraea]KGJ89862.1 response regulator receiver protein [Colwellia psychrerythraea]
MNDRILLVDDEINILNSYRRNLRNKFNFEVAQSGAEAISLIAKNKYAVIITDMQMPLMDGIELLKLIKVKSPNTVRMMLTGNSDQKTAIDALNIGDIFRFINKPCEHQDLCTLIEAGIGQYNLIIAEKILLSKTLKGTINVLAEVLTIVNPQIFAHTIQIKKYMLALAKTLKMPVTWSFEPMIQLSQLGCVMLPDSGLGENKDSFSLEQRKMKERHPCLAADLIRKIPRMNKIAHAILYQAKCFNGEGVPYDDIKGEEIPYGARMLKVVIDFLRFKSDGSTVNQASIQLSEQSQFYDPNILTAFKETIGANFEPSQQLVNVAELTNDMTVQEDICTESGLLVASKGQEISEPLRRIISHCVENGALKDNVTITVSKLPS